MHILRPLFTLLVLSNFIIACDVAQKNMLTEVQVGESTRVDSSVSYNERFSIVGDFNGDGTVDTLFESYISSITKHEIEKVSDYNDFERNIGLTIQNKPLTQIYSNIVGVDTLNVTNEYQQSGLMNFMYLGDINSDNCDDFGFMINWADYSNLNTFYIYSLKGNTFKNIFSFRMNESVNFDTDNLFQDGSFIRAVGNKTIEYKFFSDSATIETASYTFD